MHKISLLLLFACVVHHTWVVDGFRCKGINTGCCTADNPCEKGDGDCDNDAECVGGLTCGTNNCGFAEADAKDDCCIGEKYRCKGINTGCCTADNPCEKGDGDCDGDEDCAGGLTCGKDNCDFAEADSKDDCCIGEKYPNKCKVNNGGCSHKCVFVLGVVKCECPKDYTLGSDDKTCTGPYTEVTTGKCESASLSVCKNKAKDLGLDFKTSTKTKGTYPAGCYIYKNKIVYYNKNTDNRAAGCSTTRVCYCFRKDEDCSVGNGGCSHECVKTGDGVKCQCPCGYILGADKKTCSVEDACSVGNGGCSHQCVKTGGGVKCQCPSGYILGSDKKTCSDVNECKTGNGGCKHKCVNTPGGFECQCPSGYTLHNKECYDVDECSIRNGGCSHQCVNTVGGFKCQCPNGYILGADKKTCSLDPVHPCDKPDKGGCSQVCTKKGADFECGCQAGSKFDTDGKTCIKSVVCEWLRDTHAPAAAWWRPEIPLDDKNVYIDPAPVTDEQCVEQCLRMREKNPEINGILRYNGTAKGFLNSCHCGNRASLQYRKNANLCYFQDNTTPDTTKCREENVGYFGGDITSEDNVKSWEDCMKYCERDRDCRVWTLALDTSHCYLKTIKAVRMARKGMVSGSNYCDDRSKGNGCGEMDVGYYGPEVDAGSRESVRSWKQCQEKCARTELCKYWTLTLDTWISCILLSSKHGRVRHKGWVAGTKTCTDMKCTETDKVYYGRTFKSHNYKRRLYWGTCMELCKDEDRCKYWSLDVEKGICNLKSSKGGSGTQKGMVSGSKECQWGNSGGLENL